MPVKGTFRKLGRLTHAACAAALVEGGGRRIPLFASLEITRRCNANCLYCHAPGSRSADLSFEEWRGIMEDLAQSGMMSVGFTGGEPLLFPRLAELVALCLARGMTVKINTNGRLLPSMLPALPPVTVYTISLDGVKEVNDAIRGEGSADAAIAAVRAVRDAGIGVRILSVLSCGSLSRLDEHLEQVRELGVPTIFQPVFESYLRDDRRDEGPAQPEPAQIHRAVDMLVEAKRLGYPVLNSFASLAYMGKWPGLAPIRCGGGRYFVRITADGEIGVCGLKGDPTPRGIDARAGIVAGMGRIPPISCASCWCMVRTEANLALSFAPGAAIHVLRQMVAD